MALDKKPSMYSNRGAIGSAEELDAYGVWVKSEPQDISAGLTGTVSFDSADFTNGGFGTADYGAASFGVPSFVNGFDNSFGDYDFPDVDISGLETVAVDLGSDEFKISSLDDEVVAETVQSVPEDKSTQLLTKIADELTSIRTEITTLKNKFADVLSGDDKEEEKKQADFFTKEESRSPSDDEIDSLSTVDTFSNDTVFDPLRAEDEAALKELSDQNGDSPESELEVPEEVDIDFDNLGIDLSWVNGDGDGTADGSFFDDFALDSAEASAKLELADLPESDTLTDPLDELDELRDLRLEGVDSITAAMDDSGYLEKDPFLLENSLNKDPFANVSIDEANMDINLDDFAIENSDHVAELEMEAPFNMPQFDDLSIDDTALDIDLSSAAADEMDLSGLTAEENALAAEMDDSGIARDIPEAFEESTEEMILSFDEEPEISEIDLSVEGMEAETETGAEIIAVEQAAGQVSVKETAGSDISESMKTELKDVLSYMDGLLESLPDDKIKEFARSEHFDTYRKLFKELGLV